MARSVAKGKKSTASSGALAKRVKKVATAVDPQASVDSIVRAYEERRESFEIALNQMVVSLNGSSALRPHLHTLKTRLKSPESLRDKLNRKVSKLADGESLDVTADNLTEKINDLIGLRILHLHRAQIEPIHAALADICAAEDIALVEVFARTWDDESRKFFATVGIPTEVSETMYTSVHYVLRWGRKNVKTCEIQVRTLLEEVWGEIDHSINYPHPVNDVACRGQLRTLAHNVMAVTAAVDSIVKSVAEYRRRSGV